jgi:hypothetical protein
MELTAFYHLGVQSSLSVAALAAQPGERAGVLGSWHYSFSEAPGEVLLLCSWQHSQGLAQAPCPTAKLPQETIIWTSGWGFVPPPKQ